MQHDKNKKGRRKSSSTYFECFRLAFRSIPDPFVSSGELRELFRDICHKNSSHKFRVIRRENSTKRFREDSAETYIGDIIGEFENLYPEGAKSLAPRSLKHLSRCQVRENLKRCGALPYGVQDLGVPKCIQKYILLRRWIF